MRAAVNALSQGYGNARLTKAGFSRDQYDLAVPRFGALPPAHQQVDLLVTADQRGQSRAAQRLETAGDGARAKHLPGRHRRGKSFDLDGAKIAVLEEIDDQPAGARPDDDGVRLG